MHNVNENSDKTKDIKVDSQVGFGGANKNSKQTQNPNCSLHNHNGSPTMQIQAQLHIIHENQAPMAQFACFSLKHPPLTCHLILQIQGQNPSLPHPNWPSTSQIRASLHIFHKRWAPTACFWVFNPKATPFRHCSLAASHQLNLALHHPKKFHTTWI